MEAWTKELDSRGCGGREDFGKYVGFKVSGRQSNKANSFAYDQSVTGLPVTNGHDVNMSSLL
eukprot:7297078-Karenia_brevis.AAC.1